MTSVLRGRWSQRWPSAPPPQRRLLPIAGASAATHLVLIGALLVVPALRWVPPPGAPPQPAVVEMVLNDPGEGGAPRDRGEGHQAQAPPRPAVPAAPAAAAPPPVPKPPRPRTRAARTPSPTVPVAPRAALPPPVPDAPPPPPEPRDVANPPPTPTAVPNMKATPDTAATAEAAPSPPADAPPPAVRLGDEGESGETDEIMGMRTAPPSPDGAVRNVPPRYPRAAVLRQEEGQVMLLLHVNAAGEVTAAEIGRSSGYPSLDSAAQAAAVGWRFKPALKDGLPVDSTLPYGITFELTDPRGVVRR